MIYADGGWCLVTVEMQTMLDQGKGI
jgi:hypothetical protein